MKVFLYTCLAWLLALFMMLVRATCRRREVDDCRPQLNQEDKKYIYAILHGQVIHAMFAMNDKQLSVMVSRSTDGALVVPFLTCLGFNAVRGSSRKGSVDKGGSAALNQLIDWNQNGGTVGLTVDGPRGPRGVAQPGIIKVAQQSNAVIIPLAGRASKCWRLDKSWDRLEIPKPFSTTELIFGPPLDVSKEPDLESAREKLSMILQEMDQTRLSY